MIRYQAASGAAAGQPAGVCQILDTTPSTIAQWEQGKKKPNGIAQRLLNVIEHKGLEVLL